MADSAVKDGEIISVRHQEEIREKKVNEKQTKKTKTRHTNGCIKQNTQKTK